VFRVRGAGAGDALLAGALAPSADEMGREFPIAILGRIENAAGVAGCPELLPVLLERFWERASELVLSAAEEGRNPGVELAALEEPLPSQPAEARAQYEQWLRTCALSQLLLLCGLSAAEFQKLLQLLLEAVAPHRGTEQPRTPLSFHLPLGAGGGAAVCFWLDLVRRAMRWQTTTPSFFWSADDQHARLLLHLGDAPKSTLAELWAPSGTRDEFCDFRSAHSPSGASGAPALEALVRAPNTTICDLLGAFRV
jgi:hypothetical protein